jgi:hypothetical protein
VFGQRTPHAFTPVQLLSVQLLSASLNARFKPLIPFSLETYQTEELSGVADVILIEGAPGSTDTQEFGLAAMQRRRFFRW